MSETRPNQIATESSPILHSDFRVRVSDDQRSSEIVDNNGSLSYATWAAATWFRWGKGTRAIVSVLGFSLIVGAIVLIASISGSGKNDSGSETEKLSEHVSNLRAAAEGESEVEDEFGIVLEVPQGKLKWEVLQSREGRNYYAFYKVPYAKPPIGDLRFEFPEAAEKWEGVRHEKEVAPQCLQKAKYSPIIEAVGEEDCLYMNIYTPLLPGVDAGQDMPLMPTLFYIHGGGFTDGNGSRYGGKYFMDEDAVMITFQYRLGIFGFLSSEDGTIKGNMALKDQIQGLKWVKDNIKYFGGDPNRVMIYGNSAGAIAVNQLMASPMAAGLFQRAITESGPAFNAAMFTKEQHLKSYETLATEVGCWSRVNNEKSRNRRVLKCMKDQEAKDIVVLRGPDIIFGMTKEDYESEDESEKFMPDSMYNLFKKGTANKVPWIVGVNSAEWIHAAADILRDPELLDSLNNNWTAIVPTIFISSSYASSPAADTISLKAREFYFGDKKVGNDTFSSLEKMMSDRGIVYGSKLGGMMMAEFGESDVFFYYMSKRPQKSYSDKSLKGFPPMDYGASHADELQYIFNYSGYPEYPIESEYYNISRNMVRMWVQFAATGGKPADGWEPVKPGQVPIAWYEINDKCSPTSVLQKRMEFWDQFSPEDLCYA